MRRLIDDLLDATAIEAGRLSVKLRPERADAVVREAADAVGAAAGEKGVALRVAASADLPPVRADRDRVLQVLGNLLANALNVTEPGGAVAVSAAAGDREVIFEVRDTGPGIPETEREAIFEPFRRGVGTEYRGTGLGLAIAHGIVAAHGGRMWVESRVGAGSTFAFALPAASPDEAGVDAPAP
jgi:signal transduction histidine kinase